MNIVVDANLLAALASGDPRRGHVEQKVLEWSAAGIELHAPMLLAYELANSLTRMIAAGTFHLDRLNAALRVVAEIPITYHPLDDPAGAVEIALRLGRRSAYDAAYVLLAQQLNAELWTFDGPLARNAAGLGLPVRLIET